MRWVRREADERITAMLVEKNVPLQPYNTFGIVARAHTLVRVSSEADLRAIEYENALKMFPRLRAA